MFLVRPERPGSVPNLGCTLPRNRRAVKVQEAKTAHKRTEITIRTDQIVLIRKRDYARHWCPRCGCEVEAVDIVQAGALVGAAQPKLGDSSQAKKWHCLEGADGMQLVCLQSLLLK